MSIFDFDEIASRVFFFSDLDSLVTMRSVSKKLCTLVTDCTPLFCVRDDLPVKKSFFHWALMHSSTNETRYSSLFASDCGMCPNEKLQSEQMQVLWEQLEREDFDDSLMDIKFLSTELFTTFFNKFGESERHMSWLKERLNWMLSAPITSERIRFGIGNNYQEAFCGALLCASPATVISRLWSPQMMEKINKEAALKFITQNSTLNLYYTVGEIYPELHRLEESLATPTDSWLVEQLATQSKSGLTLLNFTLSLGDLDRCDFLLELGVKCNPGSIDKCKTVQTIQWLCDQVQVSEEPERFGYFYSDHNSVSSDKLISQLIKVGCSGEELAFFLDRYAIAKTYINQPLKAKTFHQFEVLLERFTGKWYSNILSSGQLLLLQEYDRERFSLTGIVESGEASLDTLHFVLERYAREVDWNQLIEAYLYSGCTDRVRGKVLSFLLQKDVETNKSEFLGILPQRWIYVFSKARAN